MEAKNKMAELHPDCPIRNILYRLSNKWTLLVLYTLNKNGAMRYKELAAELDDVSEKMLAITLRSLEADGFVERKAYPEVPPRVEYSLTARADSLFPIINQLIQWAKMHMHEIIYDRTKALNDL